MTSELHVTVAARLEDVEQRYTDKRQALVDLLDGAGRPLSIPEILREANLPQSSVYRNLAVLEQAGAVRRVLTDDEFARYELAEDLTEHHHHLVCQSCGSVEDFIVPHRLERAMERAIGEIEAATGFSSVNHRLDLLGVCVRCRPS